MLWIPTNKKEEYSRVHQNVRILIKTKKKQGKLFDEHIQQPKRLMYITDDDDDDDFLTFYIFITLPLVPFFFL